MKRRSFLPRRLPALLLSALLLPALLVTGCESLQPPPADPDAIRGPDDPRHLRKAFQTVVEAAQRGDEAAILAELERFLLTREELVALFGPEAGPAVWPGYSDAVAGNLRKQAAPVIIERVKDGYSEVYVERVGPAYPARTTPGDRALLDRFVPRGLAMYTVRLRKPGGTLGLRFNGFVYHDGRWRALLKAYDHLPDPPAEAPEEAPEAPEEAPEAPEEAPEAPEEAPEAPSTAPEAAPAAPDAPPGADPTAPDPQ